MGSGKFGFNVKKDKVDLISEKLKADISVKEKYHKLQNKLKKTEKQKTESNSKEKKIWWNQCNSCE